MKLRTLLRNDSLQLQLERKGAVISPFLIQDNIEWLLSMTQDGGTDIAAASAIVDLHERLNEKLQSKVEYRCINCSPFQIYFSGLSDYTNGKRPFFLQPSITDESKFSSLHLIAPLLNEMDSHVKFSYLSSAHLVSVPPRGKDIPGCYDNDSSYVVENFSTMKIKRGEAVIFFSNIPYTLAAGDVENQSIPLLEISILPYEARQIIYTHVSTENENFLQPYETELAPYMEYKFGDVDQLSKMKPLRKIPFAPSFLSNKEKQKLVVKISVQKLILKAIGLSKFFSHDH